MDQLPGPGPGRATETITAQLPIGQGVYCQARWNIWVHTPAGRSPGANTSATAPFRGDFFTANGELRTPDLVLLTRSTTAPVCILRAQYTPSCPFVHQNNADLIHAGSKHSRQKDQEQKSHRCSISLISPKEVKSTINPNVVFLSVIFH